MPAKQTHAERKAVRQEHGDKKKMFGTEKSQKQMTTANYQFVLPKELECQPGIDTLTVSLTAQLIETCYKQYGPAPWLYRELPRDDMPGKFSPYVNATGFAQLFVEPVETKSTKKITDFLEKAEPRHVLRHVAGEDDVLFAGIVKSITSLTPDQVLLIINNAWKLSGTTGIAVPAFYYTVVEQDLLVSPTRYLDHEKNIPEAQFKLENGLTKNRPWTVWPEHMEAYGRLKADMEAEKARKKAEADQRFAEMGEDHGTDEELAEKLAAARALMQGKKPPGAV